MDHFSDGPTVWLDAGYLGVDPDLLVIGRHLVVELGTFWEERA